MNELCKLSASAMALAIRNKEVSSLELIDAHLQQIERVNPALNAVIVSTADQARADAQAADAELGRGGEVGQLHGVPMTIKDCFDTAGVVTTGGTEGRKTLVPENDAPPVARLKAAGGIMLGKTNCPEFCLAFETDNLIYGRTNNPHNLEHVPGGSSGGEAAIIAAGGSPLGLGSDLGGSVRVPAHCCGIVGLKTTTGRVPQTGYWPSVPPWTVRANSVGPLARHVEDLILTLPILAGPDGHDPVVMPMPILDPAENRIEDLKLAMHTANGLVTPDSATSAVITQAAALLENAGCVVEERVPPGMEGVLDLFMGLFAIDDGKYLHDRLQEAGSTQSHLMLTGLLEACAAESAGTDDIIGLFSTWHHYQQRIVEFMQGYDAIICPVNAHPAMPHGDTFDNMPAFSYTYAYNLMGWPAVVLRGGTSPDGLPSGVQILAPGWREDVALAIGSFLEAALESWPMPEMSE